MLHEILLSLSGQPSPLLGSPQVEDAIPQDDLALLSPPEKALLGSIARLSELHAKLRSHTSLISSSHRSVICRSVSTTIVATHLGEFQKKILQVEKAILSGDSGYVGGYGIVPLSTIVGEFTPWTRRLEWLWEITKFIQPETRYSGHRYGCSGAALINHLRDGLQTGYLDIKDMAVQLVTAAETAWMKQLSMWLLYGKLPMYGKEDFFIQEESNREQDDAQFNIQMDLLPGFVSEQTAGSILFIGKSLNHIRAKRKTPQWNINCADCIRLSLSQSTLSKLLPLPKILEMLTLLNDFLLLGRGEFAVALVAHADSRIEESRRRSALAQIQQPGSLDNFLIREGDVVTSLAHAWAELFSLQKEEDPADEGLELARELLRLSINDGKNGRATTPSHSSNTIPEISSVSFENLLFPTPTSLTAQVRAPLDLFLSSSDIAIYSKIHSYLLGIRRAQIRLGDLWKRTTLRRTHGSARMPPRNNNAFLQNKQRQNRERTNARTQQMRPIWATASACLFVLSEIGSFFQGEVVHESWQHLREWIEKDNAIPTSALNSRPGTATSFKAQRMSQTTPADRPSSRPSSRPGTASMGRHDPEALTVAHRRHLASVIQSLFLTDVPFTSVLRTLLTSVDRFVALTIRLDTIQRNMDLETDEGVVDALVDYAQEEREVWQELRETRKDVKTGIQELVATLRDIDERRSGSDYPASSGTTGPRIWPDGITGPSFSHYQPRKPAGVDRLLMKLDFGSLRSTGGQTVTPGLVDLE
ncbi:hypothetical protein N7533_004562 [Penicillium manginii]|uniref:uncharacterized protein n=1 Tax=Penicillium manginii TaxID=203109 RepID=UPI00254706FE|nr:uncharacterized protein N7533_004562 [Penicillium manginii]KAJ5755019.1 hypothetical protein N7533_004562 [Penicillium manginii]